MEGPDADDSLCNICCVEPPDVYFVPCCHQSCAQCVQKLRIANIYKADKGVRCPFCRQVVEGYSDTPPSPRKGAIPKKPVEVPKGPDPRTRYGRKGVQSFGNANEYTPTKGITEHMPTLDHLRNDEIPSNYVVPPLTAKNNIVDMAFEKTGARNLDYMLRESNPKRGKIARQCIVLAPHLSKLANHPYGNYCIQRLLDYAHSHREGPDAWPGGFLTFLKAFAANGGLVEAAKELRGTFVCQRLALWLRTSDEVATYITGLKGRMVEAALYQNATWMVERLAEAFITSLMAPPGEKRQLPIPVALRGLELMCEEMGPHGAEIAKHPISGLFIVECIRWCLPAQEAMNAAMTIANSALKISGTKANRTLQGLLTLNVPAIALAIITTLRGKHAELCLDKGPSLSPKLTKAILATPCVEDEHRIEIVDELIHPSVVIAILENMFATDTLAFGLALLPRRFLDVRLERLQHVERRHPSFLLAELIKAVHQNRVSCGLVPPPRLPQSGIDPAYPSRPSGANHGQANGQAPPGTGGQFAANGQVPASTAGQFAADEHAPAGFAGHFAANGQAPAGTSGQFAAKGQVPAGTQNHANGHPPPGSNVQATMDHQTYAANGQMPRNFPEGLFQNLEGFLPSASPAQEQPNPPQEPTPQQPEAQNVDIPLFPTAPAPAPYIPSEVSSVANTPDSAAGGTFKAGTSPPGEHYLPPHKAAKIKEPTAVFVPGPKEPNQRAPSVDPQEAVARVEKGKGYVPPHIRKMAEQAKAQEKQVHVERREGMCAKCYVRQASVVLLDCAHLCACSQCAPSLQKCPTCDAPVFGVIQVEIPKSEGNASEKSAPTNEVSDPPNLAPKTPSPKASARARAPYNPLKPQTPQSPDEEVQLLQSLQQPINEVSLPANGLPPNLIRGPAPPQQTTGHFIPPMQSPAPSANGQVATGFPLIGPANGIAPASMQAAPPAGIRRPAPYRPPLAYRPPGM